MNYTVSMLTTKADCQALINIATADKGGLVYRKTGLERQSQSATLTSLEIAASLATVTAEITVLETILAGLPPGSNYEENLVKKRKAEYKKFLLEQRRLNYGPIALVEKEYDIASVDHSITEADAFIASLTTRMDALPV